MKILAMLVLAAVVAVVSYYLFFHKPTPAEMLAKLQKEVRPKGGAVFQTVLGGQPRAFLVLECKVYLLHTTGSEIRREKVLEPGSYLW